MIQYSTPNFHYSTPHDIYPSSYFQVQLPPISIFQSAPNPMFGLFYLSLLTFLDAATSNYETGYYYIIYCLPHVPSPDASWPYSLFSSFSDIIFIASVHFMQYILSCLYLVPPRKRNMLQQLLFSVSPAEY